MKGVVLAGGLGTRLYPLTKITNKHLLPVYNMPMVFYPIMTLVNAGVDDILIVTGGNYAGDFLKLLGNGKIFGLKRLNYTYQEQEWGIADAVLLAEDFVGDDNFVVILGDNILDGSIENATKTFKRGARILLKKVENPEDYGVAILKGKKVINIIEKPEHPETNYAVIGVYIYDSTIFDIIKGLTPSARGELEITDVNNVYIKRGEMSFELFNGFWGDAGASVDALLEVNNYVAKRKKENPDYWCIRNAG
jgi:glucose-1-phosphate thymidylyltransferase